MEVNVKYEISNDKLISILSDALGMGGAEWATLVKGYDKNNVEGEYFEDKLLNWLKMGNSITIYDEEKEESSVINIHNIMNGINVMAKVCPNHFCDWMTGHDDADTGDAFLQCVIYPDDILQDNDLIYG